SGPTRAVAAPATSSRKSEHTGRLGLAALIASAITIVLVAVAVVVGVRMLGSHTHRQAGGSPSASTAPSGADAPPGSTGAPPSTPAIKLAERITDKSGVLTPAERFAVNVALTRLDDR